ncbi:MAG: fibronectin type III domain-containing protein [Thermoguttaceae bacterium]|jgi:hypothetical protein
MVFLGGKFGKVFLRGKSPRRKREVPWRKPAIRPTVEQLEPRMMLSAVTAPGAPSSFTATAVSDTQINLSWKAVSGAGDYLLAESTDGSNWSQIAKLGSGTRSHAVTKLTPGTLYYFEVAASNSAGTTWAGDQSAITLPAAPSFTATAASDTQINLTWSPVSGASGYLVDQKIKGVWSQIDSLDGSGAGDAVSGLNPGTTYYFKVAASDSSGTTWAKSRSALTMPAAPSFTATAVSDTQINLAWKTVPGASGYQVQESTDGINFSPIGKFGSGATRDAVTGLSVNTTYYFEVGASNSAGTTWANSQAATTLNAIDHPLAATAYTVVSGPLFDANGPLYTDVHQGDEGDCWLLSGLAEVAARDPTDIQSMFTADGTTLENGAVVNLYKVRFYNAAGVAEYVTVDTELPSGGGYYDHPANGVLWVALAEKAYAQANGEGFVSTQYPNTDSYNALNGGFPTWSLQAITGKPANDYWIGSSADVASMANAWNAGQLVVLGTTSPPSSYIVPDHAYAMVGYTASSSKPFQLYNPWGTNSAGWALGTYNGHQVYGLFNADATFVLNNFSDQSIGTGAAAGGDGLSDGSQEATGSLANHLSLPAADTDVRYQPAGPSANNPSLPATSTPNLYPADGPLPHNLSPWATLNVTGSVATGTADTPQATDRVMAAVDDWAAPYAV